MTGRLRGWAPLLRIARRDALRARGRSALILAMVALPVLGLTAADVLARSAQLEPDEVATRQLGGTQARLEPSWGGNRVLQAPDPRAGGSLELDDVGGPRDEPVNVRDVAPPGYRLLTRRWGSVDTHTAAGIATATWTEASVGDPAFTGMFRLRQGSAPERADQVAVTPALFDRLGVEIGGDVELFDPARTLTLTGVLDQAGSPELESFWAPPGALIGAGVEAESPFMAYLAGSRPVTWDDVQALNDRGILVLSRAVLLDPPPESAVPYYAESGDEPGMDPAELFWLVLALAVVVVLAGLEVTLLAGAAFAVGARRQARTLGLVAAAGGARAHVRRVVLAGGVVLGAAGAVAGVALGLLLAAAARPVLTDVADADFGRFDVRPLELLAIAAVGVGTGVLAAVLPARTAARQEPVAALTGRRGQVRTARKVPAIGLVLVVVGVGAAGLGSAMAVAFTTGLNPTNGRSTALVAALIAGGAALAQIGLIVTSPAIIGLAGRWSGRLPLAGRLALRDAARHRGRSAPAMAAVLTAVTGSTALLLYVAAVDAAEREQYTPSGPPDSGAVQLVDYDWHPSGEGEGTTLVPADRVLAAITPELPPFEATVVETTTSCFEECADATLVVPPENQCFLWRLDREPTAAERRRAGRDWRCPDDEVVMSGTYPGTAVGGPAVLELVTGGASSPAAVDALRAGGVVVFDRAALLDGRARFEVTTAEEYTAASEDGREPPARTVELPAAYLPVGQAYSDAVYSPDAAKALGLETGPTALQLQFDELPSTDQEEAANAALRNAGLQVGLGVERGYTSDYGLGLLALVVGAGVVTLGAAGIATGLAQADARSDHATLAAVGAAPRLRRTLAAAQALSIAALGTVLGVAAGFVPALALIGAIDSLELTVPWLQLAQVIIGIPVLAGGTAWLLTPSRVPLERRVA